MSKFIDFLPVVYAGFPSPAEDHMEKQLDLNEYLITNPPATFFVRVKGNSMEGAGVFSGDIAIVDKSLEAKSGDIIVAVYNGGFTIKRLILEGPKITLFSEKNNYKPIVITEEDQFQVWGVVTNCIRRIRSVY